MPEIKPFIGMSPKEEKEMYGHVCRPHFEKLTEDVGLIKTKIFNGHSTSIERIEREVGEIKKMMLGMIIGCFTILVSIVIYVVFGISI